MSLVVSDFNGKLEYMVNIYHGIVVAPFLIGGYVRVYRKLKALNVNLNKMLRPTKA